MSIAKTLPSSVIASLTEEVLQKGQLFSFSVRGRSMNPVLREGDRIVVGPFQKEKLSLGQLLVYRRGDEDGVIVHRLMKAQTQDGKTLYLISSDQAPLCPETVSVDRLLGVVQRAFRGERELFLNRGWRFWWGRLLILGSRYPWILRILFRLGRIGRGFFRS